MGEPGFTWEFLHPVGNSSANQVKVAKGLLHPATFQPYKEPACPLSQPRPLAPPRGKPATGQNKIRATNQFTLHQIVG
jgi:hypothetical protein